MDDLPVTASRVLTKLEREDGTILARLARMAAIPLDRLQRVARGEPCLRAMEQLRLAEWLIRYTPSLRRQAEELRAQVLAASQRSSSDPFPPAAPTATP